MGAVFFERRSHIERHVTEQDKAMLEMTRDIDALRRELKLLRLQQSAGANDSATAREEASPDDRPPHY